MFKYLANNTRQYIFIFLTATILLIFPFSKSHAQENIFVVSKVEIGGQVDKNFSRKNFIDEALLKSFKMLMSKILVSNDLKKIEKVKIKEIKNFINSFQILDENYKKGNYEVSIKILYNEKKIKKFLVNNNISYSQASKITVVFFPSLFVDNKMKSYNQNYFYKKWLETEIENKLINFILPLEDLDDLLKLQKMQNNIKDFNVISLVNKYDVESYVFLFMYYDNKKLNTHIRANFEGKEINRNISYQIDNIENEEKLDYVLKDLKLKITDLWKEMNFINLLMPLSINVKFKHNDIKNLDKLKSALYKIKLIDSYMLEDFDINYSHFKIHYYGNPKKLKSELFKFGYDLKDNQNYWELFHNE